jgi:hypothetical protein
MQLRSTRRFISVDDIQTGMMLQFRYTKLDKATDDYTVLVIDPAKVDSRTDRIQLHAYDIGQLSDSDIVQFMLDLDTELSIDANNRRKSLAALNADEVYRHFINSSQYKDRPYKRFIPEKMQLVRQILVGAPDNKDVVSGRVKVVDDSSV